MLVLLIKWHPIKLISHSIMQSSQPFLGIILSARHLVAEEEQKKSILDLCQIVTVCCFVKDSTLLR